MSQKKDVFYSLVTVIFPIIIQMVFTIYVAHNVNRVHYGDFVLIQSMISGFSALLLTIPSASFTRFYNQPGLKDRFINEFRTYNLLISFAAMFLCFFIWLIGLGDISLFEAMIIGITSILIFNFSLKKSSIFLEIERRKTFHISVMEKVSRFFFPIIFYIVFQSSTSLILGLVIGYILLNMMTYNYCDFPIWRFTLSKLRLTFYFRYAWPLMFVALFSWVVSFSDRYFIERYLTKAEVGEYSILAQFSGFMLIFGSVYTIYINPLLYKFYGESKTKGFLLFYKSIATLIPIVIVLYFIFLVLPQSLIAIFISPQLINKPGYILILNILVAAALVSVLVTVFSLKYTLNKRLDILAVAWLFAAVVNLIGNIFIRDYGIIAAAISTLVSNITVLFVLLLFELSQKFIVRQSSL